VLSISRDQVIAEAHLDELLFEARRVLIDGDARTDLVFDGVIFGRQSKGIPSHRVQHVIALHAAIARQHVADRVSYERDRRA